MFSISTSFSQLMSEETETGTQTFDFSSETIELRLRQETEKEPSLDETPADELTLRLVDERIKQASDPILRRLEDLRALIASRTEMEFLEKSYQNIEKNSLSARNLQYSSFFARSCTKSARIMHCLASFYLELN